MQLLYTTTCKHKRPVQEQNSKLIMPYLAKCSLPMWNSDPHILLKGLYLKANYFRPLASSFLWKLSRQFWGPWDQDETVLPFHLISSSSLLYFLWCVAPCGVSLDLQRKHPCLKAWSHHAFKQMCEVKYVATGSAVLLVEMDSSMEEGEDVPSRSSA